MQSVRFTKRILAALVCFALLISYLPGMSFAAKAADVEEPVSDAPASTANDATEAESDLLSASLAFNDAHWENKTGEGTGLTAAKTSESVNGSKSNASWAFKATAAANMNGAVAQIHLNKSVDLTDAYLAMDVKYVTSGPETTFGFLYRLHNTGWADVTNNAGVEAVAGEWTTVYLTPSAIAGKNLTDCKLLTLNFNFAGTAGAERAIYIDNVRVVKIENATEDWIKLPVDIGMSAGTVKVVNELTMGGTSSQALKVVSGYEQAGSVCFNTAHAVDGKNADPVLPEDKRLPAYPVMQEGILSGWFFFGEKEPSGSIALTYDDWGTSNAVEISFTSKGNGWYLGSIDCADFTTTTKENTEIVWRVDINGLPENATVYIDNLIYDNTPASIEGLSIAYPYNSETYQQNEIPANRFNALTFNSARNEVESAQMILTPSFDIDSFELTMGDLYDNYGHIISADAFEIFLAHYVEVTDSKNGGGQETNPETGVTVWDGESRADGTNGVFPNQLVPQAAKIAKGENVVSAGNGQAIWVNLNVGDAAPGVYTGSAKLNVNGTIMQLPVEVVIYDVTLPDEVHPQSSFQIWWDQLEVGDGIDRAQADRYYDYMVSKRIMPFDGWNIQRYPVALVNEITNEWAADPKISAYSLHYAHELSDEFSYLDKNGEEQFYNEVVASSLVEMLQLLIDKNLELAAAGSDLNLFAKAYYYFGQVCDEPRNETEFALANDCIAKLDAAKAELASQLDAYPELKASFLDIKALFTVNNPLDKTYAFIGAYQDYGNVPLEGDSYAYVPQYHWLNSEEQRAMYENEDSLWWYGCTHPVNPYPTLHFNSPLITTRALGWMMYDYNIDGILYWCVNSWYSYSDPDKTGLQTMWTSEADGTPGEGTLVYPGSVYGITGPIGSIRLESFRESMEDYEYLWLLDQLSGGDADISAYTAGMYEGAIANPDVSIHHANRIQLLNDLEELSISVIGATEIAPDLNELPTDPEQVPPEDLSADMTNLPVISDSEVSIDKDFFFVDDSTQSMKVVGDAFGSPVIFDLSAKLPDLTMGGLAGYFYFGDAEPYAALSLIDDEGFDSSMYIDGATPFTFEPVEDADGWYYGFVDLTDVQFDEGDVENGASAEAVTELHLHVPADTQIHIDCLNLFNLQVEDFLSNATSEQAAKQTELTNGSTTAWHASLSSNAWAYSPTFTLAEECDISDHILMMDVYLSGQTSDKRVQIAKINDQWDSTDSRTAVVDTWTTLVWDLSGRKADTMSSFTMGIEMTGDAEVYFDNVRLIKNDTNDLFANATAADTMGIFSGKNFTYDRYSTEVYGDVSGKSWMFAGNADATGWPTALLNLGSGVDMTGKFLEFDIKTEGGRGYVSLSSLHEAGSWSNLCVKETFNASATFDTSDWATVAFDLSAILKEGKNLSNVGFIKLGFDFDTNKGTERKYYIDNVRLVDSVESTVAEDWIHMSMDPGMSAGASYSIVPSPVKAPNSSRSMKVITSGSSDSVPVTFNTDLAVTNGQLSAVPNMNEGYMSAYFYFGEQTPNAKIRLTDKAWNGGASYPFTMVDLGDGWYYGYVDLSNVYFYADQIANGANKDAIIRVSIYLPVDYTVYIDGLMFPAEVPEEYLPTEPEVTEPEVTEPEATEPEATEPEVTYPAEDFFSNADIACGELQSEVTNGSNYAWKLVPSVDAGHRWGYPSIILDKTYNISSHKLTMDVMPVDMDSFMINLSTINGTWLSGVESTGLTVGQWNTVTFDLGALDIDEMSKLGLGVKVIDSDDNYAVYIDNVQLIGVESVEDDWINLLVDVGESTSGTYEKVSSPVKNEHSFAALKLIPTADAQAKVSLNVAYTFGDNYDMSTGVIRGWFYFGDQEPKASANFSGNWSASVPQSFTFGEGVDGWYYGEFDVSTVSFYEEKGTTTDIERLRIMIPAGYEPVIVDYLMYYPDAANIGTETESDMLYNASLAWNSAHWTEATGLSYGIDKSVVKGAASMQSWAYKATAAANQNAVAQMSMKNIHDMTGKLFAFDAKLDAPEGTSMDIKVKFHQTATWSDVTIDKVVAVAAGDWTTLMVDPSALIVEGKTIADVQFVTFTFNFTSNTGVERALYIDNARLVNAETVEDDLIHLGKDTGSFYCNSTYVITDEMVKAEGSGLSLKLSNTAAEGKYTFCPSKWNMTNGTVGAWFYFGDAEAKASVNFTTNWKGSAHVGFNFGEGEDGWYYGTLNTADVVFYDENGDGNPDADMSAVSHMTLFYAGNSTIYVDGLSYTANECLHENVTTETVDSTCKVHGSVTVTCDDCGEVISTEELPLADHSYDAGVVTEPTTEAGGYTTYTCTVCGHSYQANFTDKLPATPTNVLKIRTWSLSLESDLTVNFQVAPEVYKEYSNVRMEFKLVDGIKEYDTVVVDNPTVLANGRYCFPFTGVAPYSIKDIIEVKLYGTFDGVEYVYETSCQVLTYCKNMLAYNIALMNTVIVDLMNFGSAQQVYGKHNAHDLITAELTDAQKAFGTSTVPEMTNNLNTKYEVLDGATASFKGVALALESSVWMRFKVQLPADTTGISLHVDLSNGKSYDIPFEQFVDQGGNQYFVYVTQLLAVEMRTLVDATVQRNGVDISNTVRYSIESYVAMMYGKGGGEAMDNLLVAMLNYGDAAYNFFS